MTPRDARPGTRARRPGGTRAAAAVAALLLLARPAAAQTAGSDTATAVPRRDSAAADAASRVHEARDAQAAFERRRRQLLPVSYGDAGRCDVRIGAWCYWYDPAEPDVPAEPAAIGVARRALLAVLDTAARAAPLDPWLLGQRVHYRVEDRRLAEAVAIAEACDERGGAPGDAAWCAALAGYASHAAGDAARAEAAFDRALAAMPRDERCRWTDPRILLPRDARDALGAPCTGADSLTERFWRLATPFLSRAGNDRRNEHLARHVLSRVFADAATPYGGRWSRDLDELLLRYGWPDRWTRRPTPPFTTAPVSAVGHEPWPAYRFTPHVDALLDPTATGAPQPSIDDPDAHERAAVPGVRHVAVLEVVAAAFRRGDALLVVAVAAAPPDSASSPYDSLTLVVAPEDGPPSVARSPLPRGDDASGAVALDVAAPAAPALVGVEAVGDTLRALRGRAAVLPPPLDRGFGVSDLLLFAPRAGPPSHVASLDEARRTALPAAVPGAATVGLFWELYGLGSGAHAVETTVRVDREPPGWLTRTWARLRGATPATPPRLRWTDVGPGGTVAARAVTLELGDLAAGRYHVTLAVRHADGRTASTRRTVELRRR